MFNPTARFLIGTAAIVALGACATAPRSEIALVVPVYGSHADARAVSLGQFGAVPIALAEASELRTGRDCGRAGGVDDSVVCVRTIGGKVGWVLASDLPELTAEP